ncbi:MAG TPA: arylesterase [Burkholderiales bacterium]|nr:arylesterase [Burkholderiales bacterium]
MSSKVLLLLLCLAALPAEAARTLLVFGDSLSAGYGLPQKTGWVTLLEQRLAQEGFDYNVVNASISGETTVGGKNRIESALRKYSPDVVVVELGANDGLRGARLDDIRRHLAMIVEACNRIRARVLIIGMRLPPNYGQEYSQGFRDLFSEVARQRGAALVPFLLEGFAGERRLFQHDGYHPTAEAQPRILDNVWPHLQPLLVKSK